MNESGDGQPLPETIADGVSAATTNGPSGRKNPPNLRLRTRAFALRVIRLFTALPKTVTAQVLGRQLLRSGTSVGAHYREACRAKSDADFISKIEGALQELEETSYWLELLGDAGFFNETRLTPLQTEASELTAVFVAVVLATKRRTRDQQKVRRGIKRPQ